MLKQEIVYEDFNGETQVDVVYFNLSKPELVELQLDEEFTGIIRDIQETKDNKVIWQKFNEIVLMAYGEKSPDGKSFIKNDELRQKFSQTAAFQAFIMQLLEDAEMAGNFIVGIVPKDMGEALREAEKTQNTTDPTTN